jgi:hypothetical protein
MGVNPRRAVILAVTVLVAGGLAAVVLGKAAPAAPDITAAPIHVAHTALGAVGYREVGSGPTVLMITGFSAGMDDWASYFVNGLAKHFRVVVFDNAGIGQTAALPAPLSVPEMAAQTSALITTLGLGRSDVLGWSMGGQIALRSRLGWRRGRGGVPGGGGFRGCGRWTSG